jgi:hypothetical protein
VRELLKWFFQLDSISFWYNFKNKTKRVLLWGFHNRHFIYLSVNKAHLRACQNQVA